MICECGLCCHAYSFISLQCKFSGNGFYLKKKSFIPELIFLLLSESLHGVSRFIKASQMSFSSRCFLQVFQSIQAVLRAAMSNLTLSSENLRLNKVSGHRAPLTFSESVGERGSSSV
ncbi:hypothetical protein CHARACLAT_029266 [Characodon lateralis]|uniref:Uncharacterized protein n=1 Tax=Characodon lateralis TaxID=208331 RepID=A0ABU7D1P2_9TELE|nr:hypothetical protein [Characodon lateralis]